ncbi:uncharacterized protein [Temnothorax nylanderi]|uniref:uncharacterized protein n=1 Tax=Temnothorax nylanderi TaxID=102681 RepID=UPI003A8B9759
MSDFEEQRARFRSVANALDNFKKFGRNNYTAAKIHSRISSLKETWTKCVQGHALLLHAHPHGKSEHPYFNDDQLEAHEEIYQSTLDFMTDWLEELEPCVSPNRSLEHSSFFHRPDPTSLSLKHLPPIQMPPFSGLAHEWETFRDRFQALIIQNKELNNFSRMHFLSSCLTGSARDAISGISITADNFSAAWKALVTRFENKRKLIETHVSTLYNLTPITCESASDIHALRDKADQAISALKRLGRNSDQLVSDFLVYFISHKLDPATRRAWTLKCGPDLEPARYEDLTQFLSARAFALEELAPKQSNKRRYNVNANNAATSDQAQQRCEVCTQSHSIYKCSQFIGKSPTQRLELAKKLKLCFNCLGSKHSIQDCLSKFNCRVCQKRHHSLLHLDSASSLCGNAVLAEDAAAASAINQSDTPSAIAMSAVALSATPPAVLLATAKVIVRSPAGRSTTIRALIDQGSEVTFITENVAQTLRLRKLRTLTTISAVGCTDAGICRRAAAITIQSRHEPSAKFTATAFILPSLTRYAPRSSVAVSSWSHLFDLPLADDDPTGSTPIKMIIGADLYSRILLDGLRKGTSSDQPIAQKSHLGWIVSGPINNPSQPAARINVFHCALETAISKFWEIEEIPHRAILSPSEEQCERHFAETHYRSADGRYIVRLPFKGNPPISIGESRSIAIRRLNSLKRRFNATPQLKEKYSAFLSEYEQLDHMKKVSPPDSTNTQTVYLPHHPVIRESSSTTKLRVVFDASSSTNNGTSLNSHLETGPKLQTDLSAVILRWRQHKYIYTADIAKMYRQIIVDPRDRDYQRIVWYDSTFNRVQDFQMITVTYGTAAAPFLALRVLKQLVLDEGANFPLVAQILIDDTYVDDVLFGAEDIHLLRHMRDQLCSLLSRGGFTLRKWASNQSDLLADISEEDHGLAGHKLLHLDDHLNILGISWNPSTDSFQFRVSLPTTIPQTKRSILSTIAKLFDPLGWVTPAVIQAKIFMQSLWRSKLDWDDELPPSLKSNWEAIHNNLSYLNNVRIPRWTGNGSNTVRRELHGFADAFTVAYAAAVYLRVQSLSGDISISLICGKSKVAPLKPVSVPRLELSAAHLLARLLEFVQNTLPFKVSARYCWTDSTVVLAWLSAHPSKWKTFVAHRVSDIQTRLPNAEWRHVPTADNPADSASRGLSGRELPLFSLWWNGPSWLRLPSSEWPQPVEFHSQDEAKAVTVQIAQTSPPWDLATRYSTWPKLLRVTAYLIKFITNCRSKQSPDSKTPRSTAIAREYCDKARRFWIRTIQSETLSEELNVLIKGQALPSKNKLSSLNPFLDSDGIIRVGGRLQNTPRPYSARHPILLVSHPIVILMIRQLHAQACHSGVQLTLATLRRNYWLLNARSMIKQVIFQCVPCTRERAEVPSQLLGQLPPSRVSASARAFLHCGTDYAGPVSTRSSPGRGIKCRKGYIVVFVCLATRAIHLELVSDLSTPAFVDAFSRFCSRRGLPSAMYSDNGTTFVGADAQLKRAYRDALNNPDFLNQTASDGISWHFIPPHAPHFGGLWEAGVKSVKHHLRRVLGTHTLTFEEFTTLLYRIEACLNSRPIGPLKDTLDDYEPLTPGHFLIGSAITLNPEPSVLSTNENRLSRWQLIRHMTEQFWKVWQADYVNTLQQRIKWKTVQPSVKIGTMVLIRNPLLPPCKWELGRIIQCHQGSDGLVRVVVVRTARAEYTRPITKLCLLPVEINKLAEDQPDLVSESQPNT